MSGAATESRAAILATLRKGVAAAPFAVPAPPARPASVSVTDSVSGDAWERLAAVLAPLEVRLRMAGTRAEAAKHVADIARERHASTYTRWDTALDGLGLDEALSSLTRLAPGCCQELAQADLGLALAHGALIESGSMVLVAAPGQHRAASLLPPASVILVPRRALLPDVSYLPALLVRHSVNGKLPACLNLITGPSSTADIELVLVRGVHGPGVLDLVGLDWDD
ncbi:MAG: lactate utilization protein [Humidesulfovibrio sp.]|nr:lactate utilization protein [Humidesulfovibrio sp.]